MRSGTVLLIAVAILTLIVVQLRDPADSARVTARPSLAESMGVGLDAGFARALEPRPFSFPDDHGPHPEFATEWWYLTGNLTDDGVRRIGYQFTLFSRGLAEGEDVPVAAGESPAQTSGVERSAAASPWRASRIFMGHLGVTDAGSGAFISAERFARAAAGLAGAGFVTPLESGPSSDSEARRPTGPANAGRTLRVWLEDWSLVADLESGSFALRAATPEVELDLRLVPRVPIVLNGEDGLSRKGSEPGNASYYYSLPRLETDGTITLRSETLELRGWSWLDREWSTSALESGQAGWDWFALRFDDGSDLMIYQLRRDDGAVDPASAGTFVDADRTVHRLAADDFELEVGRRWTSPATGAVYPAAWSLRVPDHDLELAIAPRLANQEHDLSVLYWEGSVDASGARDGLPIAAEGYVELTGYPAAR
jgi:predicted secreted hydrolase